MLLSNKYKYSSWYDRVGIRVGDVFANLGQEKEKFVCYGSSCKVRQTNPTPEYRRANGTECFGSGMCVSGLLILEGTACCVCQIC